MRFVKMHGLGNDFAVVDPVAEELAEDQYSQLAERWCDRHFGVGADGLIFVLPSEVADYRMRIFNPDGSEAEMCGNGIRCFGKYVHDRSLSRQNPLRVETLAGIQSLTLNLRNGLVEAVKVDMGEPCLRGSQIPIVGDDSENVVNWPLVVDGIEHRFTAVSMGNPHCVIFVEDVSRIPLADVGAKVERHTLFPEKTNVHFVQVLSRSSIRMRVWERGAGVTLACGTGACAALIAAVLNGKTDRRATVHLPGGALEIDWREDNHVAMTGPATEVFDGATVG